MESTDINLSHTGIDTVSAYVPLDTSISIEIIRPNHRSQLCDHFIPWGFESSSNSPDGLPSFITLGPPDVNKFEMYISSDDEMEK